MKKVYYKYYQLAILVLITGVLHAQNYDYGDAPVSFERNSNNVILPARNTSSASLYLGMIQPDMTSTPASVAGGASNNGLNGDGLDEDGLDSDNRPLIGKGLAFSITIKVTNTSGAAQQLRGWIDFNNNGIWDAGEYASINVPNNSTQVDRVLTWTCLQTKTIPEGVDKVYLRLRVSTSGNTATGPAGFNDRRAIGDGNNATSYLATALIGEIEDYQLTVKAMEPFICTNLTYQVDLNEFYSYSMTGNRTHLATFCGDLNALGFNAKDSFMWGYDRASNEMMKIGANGTSERYTIPNLPSTGFNVGDIDTSGYLYLYISNGGQYFTIDLNPARPATYLKLVNPTAGYILKTSTPYGTAMSATRDISDWAFNPVDGYLYALLNGMAAFPYRIVQMNKNTGTSVLLPGTVSGDGIQTGGQSYGACFFDVNGNFLVFGNNTGHLYQINMTTTVATRVTSIANPSGNNDGASCALASFSLPVSLQNFNVTTEDNRVLLHWATSSEQNNSYFEIQRSANGRNWQQIGSTGSKSENGNSNVALYYKFTDYSPLNGNNYYRLKQVDIDGRFEYSLVRQATFSTNKTIYFFPNPANEWITVNGMKGNETVRLVDMTGSVIKTIKATNTTVVIPLQNIANGMYFIQILLTNGEMLSEKLIKSK